MHAALTATHTCHIPTVQGVRDALDLVAHAANLMAVGAEQPRMPGAPGSAPGSEQGTPQQGTGPNGLPGLVNGREPRVVRGAVERLTKLLGRQAVAHKMDWFDPEMLNKWVVGRGSGASAASA